MDVVLWLVLQKKLTFVDTTVNGCFDGKIDAVFRRREYTDTVFSRIFGAGQGGRGGLKPDGRTGQSARPSLRGSRTGKNKAAKAAVRDTMIMTNRGVSRHDQQT